MKAQTSDSAELYLASFPEFSSLPEPEVGTPVRHAMPAAMQWSVASEVVRFHAGANPLDYDDIALSHLFEEFALDKEAAVAGEAMPSERPMAGFAHLSASLLGRLSRSNPEAGRALQ